MPTLTSQSGSQESAKRKQKIRRRRLMQDMQEKEDDAVCPGLIPSHKERETAADNMTSPDGSRRRRTDKFEEKAMESILNDEAILEWWRKCSGLHTVDKWVSNYQKHPAGWAALLMIQGVPEVTGRLRSKVENYAMYSALFLSATIPVLLVPPADLTSGSGWEFEIRKRLVFYSLAIGTAAHLLSILLAMAFVNALNETARDSDVFRVFARGKGYMATMKCQWAFRVGALVDMLAIITAGTQYLGWESIVLSAILIVFVMRVYLTTSELLFRSGSIVKYWRKEMGGNPDLDDPYDLGIPLERFAARSKEAKAVHQHLSQFFDTGEAEDEGSSDEDYEVDVLEDAVVPLSEHWTQSPRPASPASPTSPASATQRRFQARRTGADTNTPGHHNPTRAVAHGVI
mmetsp:Transcript_99153/g.179093  ORF Transcript_99153/g.179093 Transcript_99153/m.179093 type:complete len:401 (-) Transcript_99153:101-1303(-)